MAGDDYLNKNKTAIYAGESQWGYIEEDRTGLREVSEKPTVEEQVEECCVYLDGHPDFWLTRIYRDYGEIEKDGGKAWKRLMDDIECRKVDTIVVLSLRCVGQTYYFASHYLEHFLLPAGVRFVDVSCGFDTGNHCQDGLAAYLEKCDAYSRAFIGARRASRWHDREQINRKTVPFGYVYRDEPPYIFIDEGTAPAVRKIYELSAIGYSNVRIAKWLDDNGIPTARQRMEQLYGYKPSRFESWMAAGVRSILEDQCYTGDYVMKKSWGRVVDGKRVSGYYGEDDQIIRKDHHEPVVSRELFERVKPAVQDGDGFKKKGCFACDIPEQIKPETEWNEMLEITAVEMEKRYRENGMAKRVTALRNFWKLYESETGQEALADKTQEGAQ